MDGAMTKAPLGGEKVGKNPTDRGKIGTKRSVLTDGGGVPLGLAVEGANRHDFKMARATIASIPVERPEPTRPHLKECAWTKAMTTTKCAPCGRVRIHAHIRARGEEAKELKWEAGFKARRWVVERTHSWMNRFRRILIRWDKKVLIIWGFCIWRVPISPINSLATGCFLQAATSQVSPSIPTMVMCSSPRTIWRSAAPSFAPVRQYRSKFPDRMGDQFSQRHRDRARFRGRRPHRTRDAPNDYRVMWYPQAPGSWSTGARGAGSGRCVEVLSTPPVADDPHPPDNGTLLDAVDITATNTAVFLVDAAAALIYEVRPGGSLIPHPSRQFSHPVAIVTTRSATTSSSLIRLRIAS